MCVHACMCVIVGKSTGRHQDMVTHKVRYGHSLNKSVAKCWRKECVIGYFSLYTAAHLIAMLHIP